MIFLESAKEDLSSFFNLLSREFPSWDIYLHDIRKDNEEDFSNEKAIAIHVHGLYYINRTDQIKFPVSAKTTGIIFLSDPTILLDHLISGFVTGLCALNSVPLKVIPLDIKTVEGQLTEAIKKWPI